MGVTNSTPGPDGSHATHWLRVPPHLSTPQAAVAWTFFIDDPEVYQPVAES